MATRIESNGFCRLEPVQMSRSMPKLQTLCDSAELRAIDGGRAKIAGAYDSADFNLNHSNSLPSGISDIKKGGTRPPFQCIGASYLFTTPDALIEPGARVT